VWRPEDEALLARLEDEVALERLFRHHVGTLAESHRPHPRAAGLAVAAAIAGDAKPLARLLEAAPMRARPPELLHHAALYYGRVAAVLEAVAPDAAANAWMRSLAAWLALGEQHAYLAGLEEAILGKDARQKAGPKEKSPVIAPAAVPLEVVAELGKRAEATARDLAAPGRAALLALSWVADASRIAGASPDTAKRAQVAADRQRNAALDAALAVVGEALDEANARGDLMANGRSILQRALSVWAWSGQDEAVEEFVVDRLATIGWMLYRARSWDALRATFEPFRAVIESFARRVEQDPSRIAFAAPCAQMFVFLTDVELSSARKHELAERAVRLCPTHRNGRLNLAALLLDDALQAMRAMVLFARRDDLERVEALVQRAESLYPASTDLPEAKAMLDRVKRGRIAL
jgi:hypothetical protein